MKDHKAGARYSNHVLWHSGGKGFRVRRGHGPPSSAPLCNSPIPEGMQWQSPLELELLGCQEDSQFSWTHSCRGMWLLACISPPEHGVLSVSASWKLSHMPGSRFGLMPWNRHVHSPSVGTCPRMAANIYKHRCSWQVFYFWGNCLLAELLPAHLSASPIATQPCLLQGLSGRPVSNSRHRQWTHQAIKWQINST